MPARADMNAGKASCLKACLFLKELVNKKSGILYIYGIF
jgi:hypothetical protein